MLTLCISLHHTRGRVSASAGRNDSDAKHRNVSSRSDEGAGEMNRPGGVSGQSPDHETWGQSHQISCP